MTEQVTPTTEQPQSTNWSLLASEAFGSEFKGEVKTPEPVEQTNEIVTPEPMESQESESEDQGEEQITEISQLAQKYSLDPEWLETIEVPVKINGEEGKVKLADLKKSYQITEAAEKRLEESKAKIKADNQLMADRRAQLESQYSIAASLIDHAEKMLDKDAGAIDWNRLREQDPAEWSAKKAEIAERRSQIQDMKNAAVAQYQSTQQQGLKEQEEQYKAYLQEQQTMLISRIPEWKDAKAAENDKQAVAKYLMDQGFTKDDVSNASDHRMIVIARKAMLFDKGQNKAEVIQKKVAAIPKVLKPGAVKSTDQVKRESLERARAQAQRTGSVDDALALLRLKRGTK